MNLSVGIVGLPNVGKSTLFNALLKKQQALAANYPFATIEPNVGIVAVPDERLEVLAKITAGIDPSTSLRNDDSGQARMMLPPLKPATVEFVDIAGLVKGASEGAGLGNKFLSHIREVQIIAHVVRAFEDANIIKEGSVDPKSDFETINTELLLADAATLQKALENRKIDTKKKGVLEKTLTGINNGIPAYQQSFSEEEKEELKDMFLLSSKKQVVVLNVSEEQYNPEGIKKITEQYKSVLLNKSEGSVMPGSQIGVRDDKKDSSAMPQNDNANIVVICAKIEEELALLSDLEQKEYLEGLGLERSGLERLIQKTYQELGLISFLTSGEKEVRAWTIKKGSTAPLAAGEIHTDFIKKFIKAEVVGYADFVQNNGWKGSREKGKARLEGKDYIMQDGDVVEFKIGA
ncbi:MAG TPA: redox-regulated ATPase YchF [Candidatus Saccharimonadales bacterium]|nr:redox-regulated ATPase YchF [Candidatus Saccharimonadales bacterium]